MKISLPVKTHQSSLGSNYHVGEFTLAGRYYCAAHVPFCNGWGWVLEEKTKPLHEDGGWIKVNARFTHNRAKEVLLIAW